MEESKDWLNDGCCLHFILTSRSFLGPVLPYCPLLKCGSRSHFTSFFFCNLTLHNLVMPERENEEIRSSFFFNTANLLYVSL